MADNSAINEASGDQHTTPNPSTDTQIVSKEVTECDKTEKPVSDPGGDSTVTATTGNVEKKCLKNNSYYRYC